MYPLVSIEYMEETERICSERSSGGKRLIIILITQPSIADGREILGQFNSIHYQSRQYCGIYAPGFSEFGFSEEYKDALKYRSVDNKEWWYSDKAFWEMIDQLEERIGWGFSGETEMLLLQSKEDGITALNFRNYVTLQITHGIRKGYCDSFPKLLTQIISASKRHTQLDDAMVDVLMHNINVKEIILDALRESVSGNIGKAAIKVATKAIADRSFYITPAVAAKRRKNK